MLQSKPVTIILIHIYLKSQLLGKWAVDVQQENIHITTTQRNQELRYMQPYWCHRYSVEHVVGEYEDATNCRQHSELQVRK